MAEIQKLLDGVIEEEIGKLSSIQTGTEEKSAAIRDLSILHKLRIEEIKAQTEADEKAARRTMDSEQRKAELALKERQATQQETQQQAELSIKERQIDGADADRQMKDEQFKAELALKTRQVDGSDAERELKEKQAADQAEHQKAELALKERELNGKDADHALEEAKHNSQVREQMIDRRVRTCLQVGELVVPLVCYGIWFGMGLTFEMDNSFTSTTFKNLLNRFKPTKKG